MTASSSSRNSRPNVSLLFLLMPSTSHTPYSVVLLCLSAPLLLCTWGLRCFCGTTASEQPLPLLKAHLLIALAVAAAFLHCKALISISCIISLPVHHTLSKKEMMCLQHRSPQPATLRPIQGASPHIISRPYPLPLYLTYWSIEAALKENSSPLPLKEEQHKVEEYYCSKAQPQGTEHSTLSDHNPPLGPMSMQETLCQIFPDSVLPLPPGIIRPSCVSLVLVGQILLMIDNPPAGQGG